MIKFSDGEWHDFRILSDSRWLEESIRYTTLSNELKTLILLGIIGTTIILIVGIIILWNQRKIKKQLKQLIEERGKGNA